MNHSKPAVFSTNSLFYSVVVFRISFSKRAKAGNTACKNAAVLTRTIFVLQKIVPKLPFASFPFFSYSFTCVASKTIYHKSFCDCDLHECFTQLLVNTAKSCAAILSEPDIQLENKLLIILITLGTQDEFFLLAWQNSCQKTQTVMLSLKVDFSPLKTRLALIQTPHWLTSMICCIYFYFFFIAATFRLHSQYSKSFILRKLPPFLKKP